MTDVQCKERHKIQLPEVKIEKSIIGFQKNRYTKGGN